MSSAIFIVSFALLSIFLLLKILSGEKKHRFPPSPGGALPIIGHLHLISKPLHRSLSRLAAAHGPILLLRLGCRRVLVVSSASLAGECFSSKADLIFANRPLFPFNRNTTYNFASLIAAPYGDHWRNLRRIATVELLSTQRVSSLVTHRVAEARSLAAALFHLSRRSPPGLIKVELKQMIFELSLNVVMAMLAGKRYFGRDILEGSEKVKEFRLMLHEGLKITGASNLGNFLPAPLRIWYHFNGVAGRLRRLAKRRDKFLQGLVDELRGDESKRKTLIGVLLSLQRLEPEQYTDTNIKALILSLLTAGADTVSATIEWAMSLLLNNPKILQKAIDEINREVGNNRLLEEDDLPNLPYLQCIIAETLRFKPVAPLLVPHESSQDCVVGGYDIPRRTMLLVNVYDIHRDLETWTDPEEFKPERFENGKSEGLLLPFGMGRRKCPGEGLGSKIASLTLGTMIQCFEWHRVSEKLVDMTESAGLTMMKVLPLEAMYRPRSEMIDALTRLSSSDSV